MLCGHVCQAADGDVFGRHGIYHHAVSRHIRSTTETERSKKSGRNNIHNSCSRLSGCVSKSRGRSQSSSWLLLWTATHHTHTPPTPHLHSAVIMCCPRGSTARRTRRPTSGAPCRPLPLPLHPLPRFCRHWLEVVLDCVSFILLSIIITFAKRL